MDWKVTQRVIGKIKQREYLFLFERQRIRLTKFTK